MNGRLQFNNAWKRNFSWIISINSSLERDWSKVEVNWISLSEDGLEMNFRHKYYVISLFNLFINDINEKEEKYNETIRMIIYLLWLKQTISMKIKM